MECLLHYRFQFLTNYSVLEELLSINKIDYILTDNLIQINTSKFQPLDIAILLSSKAKFSNIHKNDYMHLYSASIDYSWHCSIIKKSGHQRIFNLAARYKTK